MYQYTECLISYQLVTFIHFQSRIFAAAKKNKEEFYKLKYCSTVVYMVPRA